MKLIDTIQLCSDAGFSGQSLITAVAIAVAESGLNEKALGDVDLQTDKWGPSVGLFQIRSLKNPGAYTYPDTLRDASKLIDPVFNVKAAYAISKAGTNFEPWSTYTYGTYTKYISNVSDAVTLAKDVISQHKFPITLTAAIIAAYFILK